MSEAEREIIHIKFEKNKIEDEDYAAFYDCPECDADIRDGSNYCHQCGREIIWDE
jgi:uncharacterized C2H2 Zn-finger protein